MATEHHYQIKVIQWHFKKLNDGSNFQSYSQGLLLLICFIAIVILLPTLFLCAHFCRRRLLSRQPAAITTAVVISTPQDQQCFSVDCTNHSMLPSSTTKSLSIVGDEKKECCICLSVFQDNEKVKVLIECQHAYHSECLDMWLSAHPSCPLCRASLQVSNSLMKKSTISS